MFFVYKHVNLINKKVYIGITSQQPCKRWRNGNGYYNSPYFYKAIQKYGWENFEHFILLHGLTMEQAQKWEQRLITFYKSTSNKYGYNLTNGGEVNKHTKETKERMKLSKLGEKNPMFGKIPYNKGIPISEHTRRKLSKLLSGSNHPNYGKHLSPETRKKIGDSQRGEKHYSYGKKQSPEVVYKKSGANNPMSKKVLCIETQEIFGSSREAGKKYGTTHVHECCNGKRKTAAKLHWKYI